MEEEKRGKEEREGGEKVEGNNTRRALQKLNACHPKPPPPRLLPSFTSCLCQSPAVEGEPAISWFSPVLSAGCLPPVAEQHAGDESHAPGERGRGGKYKCAHERGRGGKCKCRVHMTRSA